MTAPLAVADALIVDDLAPTRSWLARALTIAFPGATLREAADLRSARSRCAERTPDFALIDLRLPDGHAAGLIAELRRRSPQLCIVIPTIFDDDAYLFEALRAGASGYVLKDLPAERIAAGLRAIHEGEPTLSVPLARRLLRLATAAALQLDGDERQLLQARARGMPMTQLGDRPGALVRSIYLRLADGDARADGAV